MTDRTPHLPALLAVLTALSVVVPAVSAQTPGADKLAVVATPNSEHLMPYQVFELTFQHENSYKNPTWDVQIDVTFNSPSPQPAPASTPPPRFSSDRAVDAPYFPRGVRSITVGGFFWGSSKPQQAVVTGKKQVGQHEVDVVKWPCDPADIWKARFAPDRPGWWGYSWTFRAPDGRTARGSDMFLVVEGRVHQKGFVRIDPEHPVRMIFDDGSPFFPIGFQTGLFDANHNGSAMDSSGMEGPFRPGVPGGAEPPKLPPGPLFVRGPSMNPQNWDVHFGRHTRAGFDLWRFSPNNVSFKLFADPDDPQTVSLDNVRWEEAQLVDEMLRTTRKYGMRNIYGLFGYTKVFNDHPDNVEGMARVQRLIKYSVDRWGAYVDIWEMLNEQDAADAWYASAVRFLKSVDPYHHPVTTSWLRPQLPSIDISSPHWYDDEPELQSDFFIARSASHRKQWAKPVIYGEQGNRIDRNKRDEFAAEGIGGVWDPGSARRMRVRLWTGMMTEMYLVFWETSYARDGHFMNLWIGPEERQYVRALRAFMSPLRADVVQATADVDGDRAAEVRGYALKSPTQFAAYYHHGACDQCNRLRAEGHPEPHRWDHQRGQVAGLTTTVPTPAGTTGYWYDPRTAAIIARFKADPSGKITIAVPPFDIDIALLVTDGPAPDIDGDGIANDEDPDDDNDGTPDASDAWPLEREETADVDHDRIGDSLDADIDGDGKADDLNRNGIPDNEETDWDGDGVATADAIPWDAFPRDPNEWRDTDGDGIGDNADTDDDGDGFTDDEELAASTDPLRAESFPSLGNEPPRPARSSVVKTSTTDWRAYWAERMRQRQMQAARENAATDESAVPATDESAEPATDQTVEPATGQPAGQSTMNWREYWAERARRARGVAARSSRTDEPATDDAATGQSAEPATDQTVEPAE